MFALPFVSSRRATLVDTLQADATPEAETAPLHLLDPDISLRLEDGWIVAERPDGGHSRARIEDVSSVTLHGPAAITTPCVQALLEAGRPIIWCSSSGWYLGQTADLSGAGGAVRRAQYAAEGMPLARRIARRLIAAKLVNMSGLLRRSMGVDVAPQRRRLKRLAGKAGRATSTSSLMGMEGAATAIYYEQWPRLLKGRAAGLTFVGRNRRPPRDPVNACLSYAYAVLTAECAAAALAAGLDPTAGLLHAARPGRPSLALDLVEPFRPLVADSAVLFALNTGEVPADAFLQGAEGCWLDDRGRRGLLAAMQRRMAQPVPRECGGRGDYRAAIGHLASSLARSLRDRHEALILPLRP